MTVTQAQFRTALLDAAHPVPDGLLDDIGNGAGKRFNVYRNNVAVSLKEALSSGFPLVEKLIGPGNFSNLAGLFVRDHPPKSPLMMHYGHDFPEFLQEFEPLQHIGYLPDCARLDLALRHSYHAADARPVRAADLNIPPDVLMQKRFALAPSTVLLRSPWPLYDIWRFNTKQDAPKPRALAQNVLITRVEFDPAPQLLPAGGADWLTAIDQGKTFGDAHDDAMALDPEFDLAAVLTLTLATNALTFSSPKEP